MFDINNLQIKSNINAMQLEEAINKIKGDNNLKGLGTAFINAENKYNVNAIILASIACLESAYGTSKLAIEKNNLFGLDAPLSASGTDSYGSGYKTKEECIDYAGHRIGKQYLELDSKATWRYCEGKKDIHTVGNKWCEVKGWSDKVISIANRIEKNINGGNSMKICVVAGHTSTGKGTGAVGYINESTETRVVAKKVVEYLKQAGHTAVYGEINKSDNYLAEQVAIANKSNYDLVVQVHFNAGGGTGTETLYRSTAGKKYAEQINKKLSAMYKSRGAKHDINDVGRKLYWLSNTKAPAVLIETCFVDSKVDTDKYLSNKAYTAKLIAEGIIGQEIVEKPTEPNITPSSDTLYRVVIGTCTKPNAEKLKQEAIAKGFKDTFLVVK